MQDFLRTSTARFEAPCNMQGHHARIKRRPRGPLANTQRPHAHVHRTLRGQCLTVSGLMATGGLREGHRGLREGVCWSRRLRSTMHFAKTACPSRSIMQACQDFMQTSSACLEERRQHAKSACMRRFHTSKTIPTRKGFMQTSGAHFEASCDHAQLHAHTTAHNALCQDCMHISKHHASMQRLHANIERMHRGGVPSCKDCLQAPISHFEDHADMHRFHANIECTL